VTTTLPTTTPLELPSDQDASGRTLGDAELAALAEVVRSGTLTSTKGSWVRRFETAFAELHGVRHAVACASGTMAIHAAVAAIDPEPGDEIVTSPVTDMGALAPILYQGAIPVFADIDPSTWNVTAETIAARLGERTRAIVATHLFGNPCDMAGLAALAARHGVPVIEDCAQAFLARTGGRTVGTIGAIGCFSLQQGKHITTGEGGVVVTDDPALARRVRLFVNKAWGYGDPQPDHYFLALNGRMSELQGAVAAAQLPKLPEVVARRRELARRMDAALAGVPGVATPRVAPGDEHVYWKYCLAIDEVKIAGGSVAMARELKLEGIASAPRYIQKPAFDCEVFRERRTFGRSGWPFPLARPEALDWRPERFPGTYLGLAQALVLPWNERYRDEHVDRLAAAVRTAAATLRAG
jgi:dTDP-4-amino-4,6-dideoxygalactose transaminase